MNRSPLHEIHQGMGARFTEFAGWEMPLQYSGVVGEHKAVRTSAGLFDVSHLGRIEVSGADAFRLLNNYTTAEIANLMTGTAVYTFFCTDTGGILDDVLIYRMNDHYLVCANAVNTGKVVQWLTEKKRGMTVNIQDLTPATAQLALQGPAARKILAQVCDRDCDILAYHNLVVRKVDGREVTVARSGYTGETGYELFTSAADAPAVWNAVMAAGRDSGQEMHQEMQLLPAGLGARDTLRLEMGFPLYGHEIDENTTPIEAGLGRFVNLEKGAFEGKTALAVQRAIGVKKKLTGLVLNERGVPRQGCPVFRGEEQAGVVTSGNFSPSLEAGIALVYLAPGIASTGATLHIEIRDKRLECRVVELPFYRKGK